MASCTSRTSCVEAFGEPLSETMDGCVGQAEAGARGGIARPVHEARDTAPGGAICKAPLSNVPKPVHELHVHPGDRTRGATGRNVRPASIEADGRGEGPMADERIDGRIDQRTGERTDGAERVPTDRERTTSTIEVAEERATLDVVERATGRVSVRTRTETREESVDLALESVGANVERVSIDRYVEDGEAVPRARQEGDTWILPVLEEVLVVEKRLLLKEELHVTQVGDRRNVTVPVTLRRQVAEIEREPAAESSTAQDPNRPGQTRAPTTPKGHENT